MQQIRLKMLFGRLGLVSVYLLFLTVQLNLKYTFSDSLFFDYPGSTSNHHTSASVEKPQSNKSAVQKLRLNKRYVHQEVYLIDPIVLTGPVKYYTKVEENILPIPGISKVGVCHALLRGPPAAFLPI